MVLVYGYLMNGFYSCLKSAGSVDEAVRAFIIFQSGFEFLYDETIRYIGNKIKVLYMSLVCEISKTKIRKNQYIFNLNIRFIEYCIF